MVACDFVFHLKLKEMGQDTTPLHKIIDFLSLEISPLSCCCNVQQEYIRGISAWNFNMEDLRNQAALVCHQSNDHLVNGSLLIPGSIFPFCFLQIQDDQISISEDSSVSGKHIDAQNDVGPPVDRMNPEQVDNSKPASQL